jgi:hypothetical protein
MLIVFFTSSRQCRRVPAPPLVALLLRLPCAAFALAAGLACGSAASEGDGAPEEPTPGCAEDAECSAGQVCQNAVCVQRISLSSRNAGPRACSVLSCPGGAGGCCSAAEASATGNQRQEFEPRLQLLDDADSSLGEVRAEFSFDAPDQQGWVTFQLDGEHDLSQLEFTGRHEGVADRFLSVNTNRLDDGGCAFAFDLQPVQQPPGSDPPFLFGSQVLFEDDDFCYGNGVPGRASELAFAIFSNSPGRASLIISNITLHSR